MTGFGEASQLRASAALGQPRPHENVGALRTYECLTDVSRRVRYAHNLILNDLSDWLAVSDALRNWLMTGTL
jgi:hypothetical protein